MKFPIYMVKGKVKLKFTLEQTTTAPGGGVVKATPRQLYTREP
jgi:hypothetical protein